MNKLQAILLLIIFLTTLNVLAQDDIGNIGIKGGANYGKYTPNKNTVDYKFQFGFYIGGFYTIKMNDKWQFQPELLFSLQGSNINTRDNFITDFNGNPMPNTNPYDFEYSIHEYTISIPLPLKLYVSNRFYLESGPQFALTIDRNITTSDVLFPGSDDSFVKEGEDNFDFGASFGFGYDFSSKMSVNFRTFSSLIKRDDNIKSFVLNIGVEYNL